MEARVCKLEAQVVELGIKIDAQFHATEDLVKTLSVKISGFREEMFNFRDELLEAMGLDRSAIMNPVQRSSTIQIPSMAPQQDQFSPQSVHFEVGGSYVSAPLVPTEEIGNPTGDPELLATNREVKL